MIRSTIWRRMAHRTRHLHLNLGMEALLPLSLWAADLGRWALCRSQTNFGRSGQTPTSSRRAKKPQQPRSRRAPKWWHCCAGCIRTVSLINPHCLQRHARAFV